MLAVPTPKARARNGPVAVTPAPVTKARPAATSRAESECGGEHGPAGQPVGKLSGGHGEQQHRHELGQADQAQVDRLAVQ